MGEVVFEYGILNTGTHFFKQGDINARNPVIIETGVLHVRRPLREKPRRGGPTNASEWTTLPEEQVQVVRTFNTLGHPVFFPPKGQPIIIFVTEVQVVPQQTTQIVQPHLL